MSVMHSELNAALHLFLGSEEPCIHACTHVIVGQWTALGLANVADRATDSHTEDA